jgi:hypothetical protein
LADQPAGQGVLGERRLGRRLQWSGELAVWRTNAIVVSGPAKWDTLSQVVTNRN